MSSPSKENEEPTSSGIAVDNGESADGSESAASESLRPPAKRRLSTTAVIEISDTESDDSDICAVTTYQASADEVKRIRGADYSSSSSSSSSSDYSSDSESPWEDDSVVIEDAAPPVRPARNHLYPRANRMEDPKLSTNIKSQELIDRLRTHWQDGKDFENEDVTLTCEPFRVCLLRDLLTNPDIINNMVDDMNTLDWSRKKMDLYEFHQTTDLASLTWQRSIKGIYELLKTEVMSWVAQVTGLQLTSVSASCSLYGPGDHLLVHDDLLADRRVAFILYLAPWSDYTRHLAHNGAAPPAARAAWQPHMGGRLELLARDHRGPTDVVRRVLPQNNTLAFFKVGPDSFHQVEEVLSMELPRLSINGWFHGPAPDNETPPEPEPWVPPVALKPHNDVTVLASWVSASYMSPRARGVLQQHMERHSEASLHRLLLAARCDELLAELRRPDTAWQRAGPAHRRRYEALGAGAARGVVAELLQLWSSAAFVRLLADCTDLALDTYHSLELQRWRPGDFTLLPPREQYQSSRLEAVYYLGCEGARAGGGTAYVAAEEAGDAALVSVPPVHNALSLVYCDPGAAAFTKYLSRINAPPDSCFYIVTCTYCE